METEQQLLEAIRSGERAALRRLYDRFADRAMAVALRYVPERDEARDVLQDSFVKILTSIGKFEFRGEGMLKTWVLRIVSRQAIDHLREHGRFVFVDKMPEEPDTQEADIEEVPPDVLTAMIGLLPPNYRTVLNLYVFEQYSHREIARQLGIKENTSSSIFFRAKQMLAKMINEYTDKQRT